METTFVIAFLAAVGFLVFVYLITKNPNVVPMDDAGIRTEPKEEEVHEVPSYDLPAKPLNEMTKAELLEVAKDCEIVGVKSSMKKSEVYKLVSQNFTN
jgi:hypothetical protein